MSKKLFRISTVPMSLNLLLKGQLEYLNQHFDVTAISGAGRDLDIVKEREGVKVHAIEMHRDISLWQDLKSLWALYRYFRKEKPDIIHSITPKAGLLSMLAGKLAGVPVRMHTFTGLIFPHRRGYLQKILIAMDKILCYCATHVYPEGNGVKQDLLKYKITQKPLQVIGNGNVNGIDLDFYNVENVSELVKQDLRNKLEIKEQDFVYVFVGRLVIDKGLRELVNAFDEISKHDENVKLILVGPRENVHNPKKRKMNHTIHQNKGIVFVGYQEDVRPYLAISDVLVLPSYREGFPNTVLQAGAMGLPCIVTNISGSNEIIYHNINGLIVSPRNVEELNISMMNIREEKTYAFLKKHSREFIRSKFESKILWDKIKKEYHKNYENFYK